MIDIAYEDLLSLASAASLLPKRRANRPVHVATVYRWTTSGCKGVILEAVQVGGTRCTSIQALQRFCDRLTNAAERPPSLPVPAPHIRTVSKREAAWIKRELDRGGF